jgi:soluble lytic murein transglycosylase
MRRLALFGAGVLVVAALLLTALHRDLPGWYAQAMPAWCARAVYPLEHERLIRQAARRNDLDPALVAAVIYAESGFREGAVSESGAVGLMQLLPSTATEIARRTGGERFEVADLRDPRINIRYGSNYLRYLLDRRKGSLVEAVAAYHAGVRNVDRWAHGAGGDMSVDDIPFADTREYAREVVGLIDVYRRAYGAELGPAP